MKPLLKAQDVAKILGVDVSTVWRMTKDGRLKSIVLGPKIIRFTEEHIQEFISLVIHDVIESLFDIYAPKEKISREDIEKIYDTLEKLTQVTVAEWHDKNFSRSSASRLQSQLIDFLENKYKEFRAQIEEEIIKSAEKWILLELIDNHWKIHLSVIDTLKEGIGLRGYGQKNPLIEYKRESFEKFKDMMHEIGRAHV